MDSRVPAFHQSVCEMLIARAKTFGAACDILLGPSEQLTAGQVHEAIRLLEADLPSPLRATLFDLGRILSGALPTDDIPPPPAVPLKIYRPED